ncbi:MAG: hypothetical protein K9J37_13985 [Saprospiraceae bacterium]|nr:hypothetical protein [Saprospiraceae bacterium]MCF8251016.1 hypothetical protein [Saprospiraceae bacterium]MCF8281472.1 hypothetical protein [Bacteroidales bacterium]MCF8311613.1 hypothetical protein [Saprospiraceae bacterium]MCF8440954.1 hypothetical protein [Saprospiraceae bacterium]
MKKHFVLLAAAIFCFAKLPAQTQPLTTQSISIFKNSQAFYLKSGALKPTNGRFLLPDPTPQALYGTLWFNSPEGSLTRVATYPDTLREQKTEAAVAIWDLLRNNIGKTVTCVLDEKGNVGGNIISVSPAYKNNRDEPQFSAQSLVTIQSQINGGWYTIPAGQIRYVLFGDKPNLDVSMPKVTPRHLFELSFNNKKGEQPFEMMYLANGLNWAPEYLLELTGETAGTLSLQGEVANDAEDILNTTVNLVVGVPNFAYANRLAYLVDFLQVINPMAFNSRSDINAFSNSLRSQSANYYIDGVRVQGDLPPVQNIDSPEGSRNEDLFIYTLKNFSLPKGGRSVQPIFKENTAVAHIYECKLPDNDENNRYYESDFLFAPLTNKTYHTLRLENKTKQPWTTAPILVVNTQGERRPISQDLMTYTPIGGKTFVKLTEAVEVKVEQAEREISRQTAAWTDKRRGFSYDLVQVEGKVKVKNFKDKQLDLRIQRTISGNLKKTSIDWLKEDVINPNNPRNRKTNVCWETPIKANSELEITYTYEIYVPGY